MSLKFTQLDVTETEMLPSHHVARILFSSCSLSKRILVAGPWCFETKHFYCSGRVEHTQTLQHKMVTYLMRETVAKNDEDHTQPMFRLLSTIHNKHKEQSESENRVAFIVEQIEALKLRGDPQKLSTQLRKIDDQAFRMLEGLSLDEILILLNKIIEVIPYRLRGLRTYTKSIEVAKRLVDQSLPSSSQIVNMMFIASVGKNAAATDVRFFLNRLRTDFKDLPFMVQCIVAVSTFKVGVRLNKESIKVVEDVLFDRLDVLVEDTGLIVSLIKALMKAGPTPEFSLDKMSKKLREMKESLRISTAVPVLGIYAAILEAEKHVVRKLIDDSINDLSRGNYNGVRIKDVDRLLWATTSLNCKLSSKQVNVIEKLVDHKILQYSKKPEMFVNTTLCLWILRSPKCRQRVEYCFREQIYKPLLQSSIEDRQRLNLLMECVKIEAPNITIPQECTEHIIEKPYKSFHSLDTICEMIKCLSEHLDMDAIKIDCPIKAIRLYGVSATHQSLGRIHIDLLNNVTCLKNTTKPNGLLSLKFRLLKSLGYYSIAVQYDTFSGGIESVIPVIEEKIKSTLEKRESDRERYRKEIKFITDIEKK